MSWASEVSSPVGVGRGPPRPFLVIVSGEWPQQPRGGLRGSAWVLVVSVEVPQEKGTQLAEQTQRLERAPARPTASLPGSSWSAAEEAQAHCAPPPHDAGLGPARQGLSIAPCHGPPAASVSVSADHARHLV